MSLKSEQPLPPINPSSNLLHELKEYTPPFPLLEWLTCIGVWGCALGIWILVRKFG